MPFINSSAAPHPRLLVAPDTEPSTSFIAALILPSAAGSGALAIIDHAGELILHAALPDHLHHDVSDPEGLIVHLTHFVPCLSAITAIFVSWFPGAAIGKQIRPSRPRSLTSRLHR